MSLTLNFQNASPRTSPMERAILEALAYSDIFDQPLRLEELHRYLPIHMEPDHLLPVLNSLNGWMESREGYYFLAGREEIVEVRREREARSRDLLPYALRYGQFLGRLPFVRMVALTGSLAVLNVSSRNADFDYMLVAATGHLWTTRAFALLFNRFTKILGHTLCPNLIIAESALEWRQQRSVFRQGTASDDPHHRRGRVPETDASQRMDEEFPAEFRHVVASDRRKRSNLLAKSRDCFSKTHYDREHFARQAR
jgi:hypothetical protein